MWQALVGLCSGIILSSYISYLPPSKMLGLSLGCLGVLQLACLTIARGKGFHSPLLSMVRKAGSVAGMCCLGLFYGQSVISSRINNWLPECFNRVSQCLVGVVAELPQERDWGTRFRFDVAPESGLPGFFGGQVQLGWQQAPELHPGEVWQLCVRLKRPHGFVSPGAGNYEAMLLRQSLVATGYVRNESECANRLLAPSRGYWLDRWRNQLSRWLDRQLGESRSALVKGLLTGDGRGIQAAQWQLLRETGTLHLMVISGLHISLTVGFGWLLVRALGLLGGAPLLRVGLPKLAMAGGLGLGIVYGALAGFGLPVQRALVMLGVGSGCFMLSFRLPLTTVYLLALTAVLLINPLGASAQGFWLSFLAVAVLLYGFSYRKGQNRWQRLVKAQIVILLGLAPVLSFIGQPISLVSPLINLVSIVLVGGLLLPLLLISLPMALVIPPAAVWLLGHCASALEGWLTGLAYLHSFIQQLGLSGLTLPVPNIGALIFSALGAVILLLPGGLRVRWLAPLCFLPWLRPVDLRPGLGTAEVVVLDVGQGLSVAVRTRNHLLIYDTGDRFTPTFSAAGAVVLPFVKKLGQSVDRIVISHSDRDHMGGLKELAAAYPGAVIDPPLSEGGQGCNPAQPWCWDGVQFRFLERDPELTSANDSSCVLQVCAEDGCALLTGDITHRREQQLVETYGATLASQLLLAPHHGSRTSSSEAFLRAVRPDWISVSSGYASRFGHPSQQVIARLGRYGQVWVTAVTGTQIFPLKKGGEPFFYRDHGPWWQRSW